MARTKLKRMLRGGSLFRRGDEILCATKWTVTKEDGKEIHHPIESFKVTQSFLKIHAQMIDEEIAKQRAKAAKLLAKGDAGDRMYGTK